MRMMMMMIGRRRIVKKRGILCKKGKTGLVFSIKSLGGNFKSIGSCSARNPLLRGFRMTCDPERAG